jgi:hypothetical protein
MSTAAPDKVGTTLDERSRWARLAQALRSAVSERLPLKRWLQPNLAASNLQRIAPRILVGVPVLFNLWVLRAETTVVQNANDSHLHFAMVRWARSQILEGRIPLDGWFPYLGLGYSQFRHYSSLPHILTAYVSLISDAATTYFWSVYLLLALWPISVYLGARLFGWDRWTAAGAALVAPLLVSASSYGYEQGSYTWYGYGLWAQLWGMWLLPIALGLSWRAVRGKGSYALAALAVSATIASHFLTGYLALLAIGLWVVIAPRQVLPRLARSIILGLGALLVAAWTLVPIIQDDRWRGTSEYGRGNTFDIGYGAPKVLGWLVTGQIYDLGRPAVVTVLVGVGLIVCLLRFRRDERARAVVALWLLSLALYFGSATLGPLVKLLPDSSALPWHRFIIGVHLAGLILAGIGGAWLGNQLMDLRRRFVPGLKPLVAAAAVISLAVVALYPGWSQVSASDIVTAQARSIQQLYESTDGEDLQVLIDRVKSLGGGRVYAGGRWSWGQDYRIGYTPVYTVLSNEDVDAIGLKLRVSSLMSDEEILFDETNPAQYDLFNVRYLILPSDRPPPIKATLIAARGRHTLWQVATSGYLEVVDTTSPPIVEDGGNVASRTVNFLGSQQLARLQYPTVAFAGDQAAAPTLSPGAAPTQPAGLVVRQSSSPADGTFTGEIVANRLAVVLLKVSYDPRWRVTLDGVEVRPQMIAPALVGRTVAAGRHTITFQYVPDPEYPLLLALGFLALVGLSLGPRLLERRRQAKASSSEPPRASALQLERGPGTSD